MNFLQNKEITKLLALLENSMLDNLQESMVNYTPADVESCMNLIRNYLKDFGQTKHADEGMLVVKSTVLALDQLNIKSNYELIVSTQQEYISDITILAGNLMGYSNISHS